MDAAQTDTTLPRAHRTLAEISADMEALRAERAAAIDEMNAHRTENRGRAYTIADVLERLRLYRAKNPDSEACVWFENPRIPAEGLEAGDVRLERYRVATSVHSWRGRYNEPAIGGQRYGEAEGFTLSKAITELERLTIEVFQGYKGGNYEYDDTDTLFVDDYGDYSGEHVIVGVIEFTPPTGGPGVLLVTLNVDEA